MSLIDLDVLLGVVSANGAYGNPLTVHRTLPMQTGVQTILRCFELNDRCESCTRKAEIVVQAGCHGLLCGRPPSHVGSPAGALRRESLGTTPRDGPKIR